MKTRLLPCALVLVVAAVLCWPANAQRPMPVTVGQQMPDFTLQAIQGGQVTLSSLRGKNVLLIFPRGRVSDHWCQICHYQYAELASLELERGIRAQHNMEVLFVLPYSDDVVQEWVDIFPSQMETIEGWKNPADPASLSEGERRWMETARMLFPKRLTFETGNVPLPFPILVDADKEVSQRLGLFTTSWGGSDVEQNIPTIFILDRDGVVQFKYHSQSTVDRPGYDYLFRVIENLIGND